jgi:hypothetical protein
MPTRKLRELREEQSFKESVELLGGSGKIDSALSSILEALSHRPEGFDLVPGWEPIRVAKTVAFSWEGEEVPPLRLWFVIHDEDTVCLLYVEPMPIEDLDL